MPDITIKIGGREFQVVCKEGEEDFLRSAAAMLDTEAQALSGVLGRIPESRMLLMAGLMLADKTANLEDQLALGADTGYMDPDKEKEFIALKSKTQTFEKESEASQEQIKRLETDLSEKTKKMTEVEKELEHKSANLQAALDAMKRMVQSVEDKSNEPAA